MVLNDERLDKIWAMDPEYESFVYQEYWHRLSVQDASLVEVWLTNTVWLDNLDGGDIAIGHMIYCLRRPTREGTTLHRIAAESVYKNNVYPADLCDSVAQAKASECSTTTGAFLSGEPKRRPSADSKYNYSHIQIWSA